MDEKHNWVYGAVLKITDDLETNERKANESKQKLIIKKLIAKKKKTGQFNESIEYKGITYGMCITLFDGKPFSEKRVKIYAYYIEEVIAYITPQEAGYTEREVTEMLSGINEKEMVT